MGRNAQSSMELSEIPLKVEVRSVGLEF
jgi:hypothetical protein